MTQMAARRTQRVSEVSRSQALLAREWTALFLLLFLLLLPLVRDLWEAMGP